MNSCPHCSHNLLRHLRSHNLYWYCSHCHLETSDSFIRIQNRHIRHIVPRSEPVKSHRSSLIAAL